MKTQNQQILDHLKSGKSITASYAMTHFRVWRLAARIHDLRGDGYRIATATRKIKSKRTGKPVQYAVYSLEAA